LSRAHSRKAIFARTVLSVLALAGCCHAERLPIKTYTTTDGLPRDFVTGIVQDSSGFLWFCTIEGLSRFDGYQFKTYGAAQGLLGRYVTSFLETRSGVYWVTTTEGLYRFDPNPAPESRGGARSPQKNFIAYGDHESLPLAEDARLLEDMRGTVWCGAINGLYRLDEVGGQWTLSLVELEQHSGERPELEWVHGIVEDGSGSLWVLRSDALYRRFPNGTVEQFGEKEGLSVGSIHYRSMLVDREGRIWLGTTLGLYQLVPDPHPGKPVVARVYTTKDGLANNNAVSLFQTSDGRLWAGCGRPLQTAAGLDEFVPDGTGGGRFRTYTTANGLSSAVITTMAEDRAGNLWLGTETSGAMKLSLSGLTTYDREAGFEPTRVRSIFENRAGQICVLGNFDSVNTFDGSRFASIPLRLPAGKKDWGWGWHQVMFEDHAGEWWMPTGEGLVRYPRLDSLAQITTARPSAVYTTKDGLPGNSIFRLFEDSRGDVWISTIDCSAPLTRWERATGAFHHYTQADGGPGAAPTAFREDASGNIWIGLYSGGLLRYRAGSFASFGKADGLPAGLIRCIYLDHASRLWVATDEGGVVRIDDPSAERVSFVTYSTAEGLSSSQATCVVEDQMGRIYIGTGQGVNRLDPASGNIKQFTTTDGLANSYVYAAHRDRQGALWFGTFFGLSKLVPGADPPALPPTVLVTGLRIGGVPHAVAELGVSETSLPDLDPSRNQIQIDFVGLSLRAGETLRYQYKLEGAAAGWSEPSQRRSVDFANLKAGSYRFAVRAITADGGQSPTPAIVTFRILPPLWQRWWLLSLAFITVGSVAFAIIKLRSARRREREHAQAALRQAKEDRLRELEHVRRRIAADLHDDIGSNLTRISLLSEVAQRKIDGAQIPVKEQLSSIGKLSRELVDSMSEIVWAINPKRDHLSDLSQRMRHFASDLLSARQIEFRFPAGQLGPDLAVGANVRREFFLIFKEGVNNIVRHSACTEVEIRFLVEQDNLVLTLNDNGRGFDTNTSGSGHGLASMRGRIQSLGGTLEINSTPGQGTMLKCSIPLHPQLPDSRIIMR
jgi:signal transduction histidine kinase/ligand-binding sensor domain-containing protein